jgi:hypothetical protein
MSVRTVTCRRCRREYEVHPWAEPFTYWFCFWQVDGAVECRTFNVAGKV